MLLRRPLSLPPSLLQQQRHWRMILQACPLAATAAVAVALAATERRLLRLRVVTFSPILSAPVLQLRPWPLAPLSSISSHSPFLAAIWQGV